MAEAQTTTVPETPAPGGAPAPDPKIEKDPKPDPKPETKADPAAPVPGPAATKGAESEEDEDGEPKPDDKGMVTLPFKKFEGRVKRAAKAALKSVFGTDDRVQILAWKEEFDGLQKKQEDQRRADMSEKQRIEDDLVKERSRADAAEAKAARYRERQVLDREDRSIREIATGHVAGKHIDYALFKFAKHIVKNYSDEELKTFDMSKDGAEWFREFAETNPEFSTKPAQTAPAIDHKVDQKPITTGKQPAAKPVPPPSGGINGKTARPGQPNSMNKQELATWKRENGYNW